MQKLKEKKILGNVTKKLQIVETFWDCPEFSKKQSNQNGITLIALIITIIVMLILVGVTINVALNGGLFEKGEKAAFQTEASTVKEQLEMAKALKVIENDGKLLNDYSGITMDLTDLDTKTKNKYANKIVVAKNGDICYNPANVTDQEKAWLEEIGIIQYIDGGEVEEFTFTVGEIAPNATFEDSWIIVPASSFWDDTVSENLKNSTTSVEVMRSYYVRI